MISIFENKNSSYLNLFCYVEKSFSFKIIEILIEKKESLKSINKSILAYYLKVFTQNLIFLPSKN